MRLDKPVISQPTRNRLHALMMVGFTTTGFLAFFVPGTIVLYVVASATALLTTALIADDLSRRGPKRDRL